jgi:NADH-quinone oxidoreductase subunit D
MSPAIAELRGLPRNGDVLVGLSAADRYVTDCVADLGLLHPGAHGMPRLRLSIQDDIITAAEPVIGQMHRGVEKLFESRDYRQVLLMVDRHDWLSPVGSEIGAAMCMEFALGIEVSRRAQLLRMVAAELSRIAAHAMFISEFPMISVSDEVAQSQSWQDCVTQWRELRNNILDSVASLTGARVHVMWNVIGGVLSDADEIWSAHAASLMNIEELCEQTNQIVNSDAVAQRLRSVGVIDEKTVREFAVTGLIGRASGLDIDARRQPGYLLYDEFPDHLPTFFKSTACAHARLDLLINEARATASLAGALLHALAHTPGEIKIQLPKTVRLPEGSVYRETENALGINGFWLVSAGDKMPHRLKIRSASFATLNALTAVLQGLKTADLIPTLATIPYVAGDSDR